MSYLTQMAGLAYHNFASAAVGIVLAIVVIRGIARKETDKLGNFWVDTTRCLLWVLLPVCLVGSLILVSEGVVQNLKPYTTVDLIQPYTTQVTGSTARSPPRPSHAGDCARAGGLTGSDQGIRDQRWRIFQRQQRTSL